MDLLVRSLGLTVPLATGTGSTSSTRSSPVADTTRPPSLRFVSLVNSTNSTAGSGVWLNSTTTTALNTTRLPDLNNATECWSYYWSYTKAESDWWTEHQETFTTTSTFIDTVTTTLTTAPIGNSSWTSYCDGLPRFADTADWEKFVVTISSPIYSTYLRTYLDFSPMSQSDPYTNYPTCRIAGAEECKNLWSIFATSLGKSLSTWSSKNIMTISVPANPTSMVVNGEATPLTAAPGQLPPLPLRGSTYTARKDSTWYIDDAYNFVGETTITPGQQVTFTWNWDEQVKRPFGPSNQNCTRPNDGTTASDCPTTKRCTIRGQSVELMYFPPPTSSRDLCANTSPGFNRYSQSIYSQPHRSTIINSTTFWMDKAYVRYNTVSAFKMCDFDHRLGRTEVAVGGTYTKAYVEVESKDISTICGWQFNPTRPYGLVIGATPVPMNFDDLSGPVPESAYQCLSECVAQGGCTSIISSLYKPNLAVPPQVRALDPEWAECVPYFEGTQDPPTALQAVPFLEISTSAVPTPEPATLPTPKVTPKPPHPPPTSSPGDPDQRQTQNPSRSTDPPGDPNPGLIISTTFTNFIPLPTEPPLPPNNNNNNSPNPNPSPNLPGGNQPSGGQPGVNSPTPVTTVGDEPVFFDPSSPGTIVIGNPGFPSAATLTAGGAPLIVAGTTLSLGPQGTSLSVSGTKTLTPITTINGQPVFIDPSDPTHVIFGDPGVPGAQQTLAMNNGIVVISGTTLSLGPLATATALNGQGTAQIAMIINGLPITLLPDGSVAVVVNGVTQTIQPGSQQISVNGHTVFVAPSGQLIVDGQEYKVEDLKSTPGSIVILGPNGSRTTVALLKATASASGPMENWVSIISAVAAMQATTQAAIGSESAKSLKVLGSATPVNEGGKETERPSAPATSSSKKKGGANIVGVEAQEILCLITALGVAVLCIL